MYPRFLLSFAVTAAVLLAAAQPEISHASDQYGVSGPYTHGNLAIYLIHGTSVDGDVPLTLQEALAKGAVRVHETGEVNELDLENLGDDQVFVQSGDIVKGGQQDRVLTVSLVVPPHSGRVPIAAFCVEQGRWSARGAEDATNFASANAVIPSHEVKMAMKAPMPGDGPQSLSASTGQRQREVWNDVAQIQHHLSTSLDTAVASPRSKSSLQLTLENTKLKQAQADYVEALQSAGETETDIVGYAFAINGKLNSADIYPSNGLFRKMWPKLLAAAATEALASKITDAKITPPPIQAVTAFLDAAKSGKASEKRITQDIVLETRESDVALSFETKRSAAGDWVHRNYLAR